MKRLEPQGINNCAGLAGPLPSQVQLSHILQLKMVEKPLFPPNNLLTALHPATIAAEAATAVMYMKLLDMPPKIKSF